MALSMDLALAERHVRRASLAGLACAGIMLAGIIGARFNKTLLGTFGLDTGYLVDSVILLSLSLGVFRKSRISALLLLMYFVTTKIVFWSENGLKAADALLTLAFVYLFVQGVIGTFVYHAKRPRTTYSRRRRGYVMAATGVLAVLASLTAYIAAVGPNSYAVRGDELSPRFLEKIRTLGLLDKDEHVKFFYSDALVNIENGFYLFTDRKVIVYSKTFTEPALIVPFSEISDIQADFAQSILHASTITLTLYDNTTVWFPVSIERHGDRHFYEGLLQTWQASLRKRGLAPLHSRAVPATI